LRRPWALHTNVVARWGAVGDAKRRSILVAGLSDRRAALAAEGLGAADAGAAGPTESSRAAAPRGCRGLAGPGRARGGRSARAPRGAPGSRRLHERAARTIWRAIAENVSRARLAKGGGVVIVHVIIVHR